MLAVVFVLVHGNNGAGSDWDPFIRTAQEAGLVGKSSLPIFFFVSRCSEHRRTVAGVQVLADRLIDELTTFVRSDPSLSRFPKLALYFVAHSLGGLIVRAALPSLLMREPRWEPLGFVSLASPHVGAARPGGRLVQDVWKWGVELACKHVYNQTGRELMHWDAATPEEGLLARMADPDGPFVAALLRFRFRTLVASPFQDMLVPYGAAAISPLSPYVEEFRATDHPCSVWGHSGFPDAYDELLGPYARPDAKGKPDAPGAMTAVALEGGWEADGHRFAMWPARVMRDLRNGVSFRRLDVMLYTLTRWNVHDGFLQKKLRGILPGAGAAGDEFLGLLVSLLQRDVAQVVE